MRQRPQEASRTRALKKKTSQALVAGGGSWRNIGDGVPKGSHPTVATTGRRIDDDEADKRAVGAENKARKVMIGGQW